MLEQKKILNFLITRRIYETFLFLFHLYLFFHAYAELKYEKVGSWDLQLDGTTFGMTSNSSYSTYFPGGEITLNNGVGKINICVEDATLLDEIRIFLR